MAKDGILESLEKVFGSSDQTLAKIPTVSQPTVEQLEEWAMQGFCEAVDGCFPIEPDGHCEHGQPSWLLHLGLI